MTITLEGLFTNWLALVGGLSGLLVILYMAGMIYYNRRKDADIQAVRRDIAEVKGILLGRKRP